MAGVCPYGGSSLGIKDDGTVGSCSVNSLSGHCCPHYYLVECEGDARNGYSCACWEDDQRETVFMSPTCPSLLKEPTQANVDLFNKGCGWNLSNPYPERHE